MCQVVAVRELHRLNVMQAARQESKPTQLRQDKARPKYKLFDVASTPLGRAFGWSSSSKSSSARAEKVPSVVLSQRVGSTSALRLATVRQPEAERSPVVDRLPIRDFRLRNPSVLCYMNASVLALMHVSEVLGDGEDALEALRQDITAASVRDGSALLTCLRSFSMLSAGWEVGPSQQDAAEFSSHLITRLDRQALWQSRVEEIEGIRVTDTGVFVFLQLPTSPATLQELFEAWTFQHNIYGLTGEWPKVPVVLGRYASRSKNQARIYFDGDVLVPVFGEGRVHIGNQPTSGHYRALLRAGNEWLYSNDSIPCARTRSPLAGQAWYVVVCSCGQLWPKFLLR